MQAYSGFQCIRIIQFYATLKFSNTTLNSKGYKAFIHTYILRSNATLIFRSHDIYTTQTLAEYAIATK